MERYFAIGDIHGCVEPLDEMLAIWRSKYSERRLVFLGDYIDRGTDPEGVLQRLRSLDREDDAPLYLLGNHEEMLLSVIQTLDAPEKQQLFLDAKRISRASYEWIESRCQYSCETAEYLFAHAGPNPGRSLAEQRPSDYAWTFHSGPFSQTDKWVIHGHQTQEAPGIIGNNVNVDTGCGKNGPLSAVILPELEFITTQSRGMSRTFFDEPE
jgi:serine/threonine protein phosphatase 1